MTVAILMREWERITPGDGAGVPLSGLTLMSAAERALARRLANQQMLHLRELARGLEIESTSFVGTVRLGDVTITIAPKVRGEALLRLICYAYELRDLFDNATFAEGAPLFQELLLAQLHITARDIVGRGLHRRYMGTEEELTNPRGRIDITRLARRGVGAHSTLPCRHHLRREDCLINRVLLGGLRLGAAVTTNRMRAADLHAIADLLALSVHDVPLTRRVIAQAQQSLDRLTEAYGPALKLIEVLFDAVSPALEERGESLSLPGFLFDMNRLFQRLVSRFLRENLVGCKVEEEERIREMMRYAHGENPRARPAPRPRPDFAVTSESGEKTLVDAKYRDLWARALPRDMLYQLAVYALSQPPGGRATILYPTPSKEARPARLELRDEIHGWARASVVLQPLELEELADLIARGGERAAVAARAALARRIVFDPMVESRMRVPS